MDALFIWLALVASRWFILWRQRRRLRRFYREAIRKGVPLIHAI